MNPFAAKKDFWVKCFTSVGFLGYCPVASGTVGALCGMLIFWLIRPWFWVQVALILLLFPVGVRLCTMAEDIFKERDSHFIIVDEVLGFLITMLGIPNPVFPMMVLGFVLNRLFDIWKPFPLKKLEEISKGWGVMLDDVAAGIYSNVVLRLLIYIF